MTTLQVVMAVCGGVLLLGTIATAVWKYWPRKSSGGGNPDFDTVDGVHDMVDCYLVLTEGFKQRGQNDAVEVMHEQVWPEISPGLKK